MKEVPFPEFQKDILTLFDYVLAKPNEKIDMDSFTEMTELEEIEAANETHICGSPACAAGYSPEVFPKRFRWNEFGNPVSVKDDRWHGEDILVVFAGPNYPTSLRFLFYPNCEERRYTDRQVLEHRREEVSNCTSYEQLCERLSTCP